MNLHLLKRGILLFWALWFSVVLATNLCDALKQLGLLDATWSFASGNFSYMQAVAGRHHTPRILIIGMFAGVVAWQALVTALHWRAFARYLPGARAAIVRAFVPNAALWGAFMVADEFFIAYEPEATHIRLFMLALLSLLTIFLLPDDVAERMHP